LLDCCIAVLIGVSLVLLPILPYLSGQREVLSQYTIPDGVMGGGGLESVRRAIEVNEVEHAGESVVGRVPWHYLPLIVGVGFVAGLGAYTRARSHTRRTG